MYEDIDMALLFRAMWVYTSTSLQISRKEPIAMRVLYFGTSDDIHPYTHGNNVICIFSHADINITAFYRLMNTDLVHIDIYNFFKSYSNGLYQNCLVTLRDQTSVSRMLTFGNLKYPT